MQSVFDAVFECVRVFENAVFENTLCSKNAVFANACSSPISFEFPRILEALALDWRFQFVQRQRHDSLWIFWGSGSFGAGLADSAGPAPGA